MIQPVLLRINFFYFSKEKFVTHNMPADSELMVFIIFM